MQVYLHTLGCRLNEAELESWSRGFRAAGDRVVASPEAADVVVLNTCAVTSEAARKSRRLARGLHRRAPSARIVLTGCFAELERDSAAEIAGVDLIVGNDDKDALVAQVRRHVGAPQMPVMAQEAESEHAFPRTHTRGFVKVQDGCRNRCTFCIVTVARGNERSRTIDDIVAEVNGLHEAGYQEVVLTGVHLGGYGSDLDDNLRSMIEAVLERTRIPRVRLGSLEPWDLPEGFFSLWANPRMCPHIHLPLQSGSDSVLRRMARRCSVADFEKLVSAARSTIPDFVVTTDMIVGFPGETDAEFDQTLQTVDRIGFAHIHCFSYSRREGTVAARLPGQLPNVIKKQRSRRLHELAQEHKLRHLQRVVGSTMEVLFESRHTGSAVPMWSGYTPNYLKVTVQRPDAHHDLRNLVRAVHLDAVNDRGELRGTLVDSPA